MTNPRLNDLLKIATDISLTEPVYSSAIRQNVEALIAIKDIEVVEALIDRLGLAVVTAMLARIAGEKAEHIRVSYNDRILAKTWSQCGDNLENLSERIARRGL